MNNNSAKPQNYNAGGAAGGGGGDDDSGEESGSGWISWFCDLEGHEFFIEVTLFLVTFRWMMSTLETISTCMASKRKCSTTSKNISFSHSYASEGMQMILSAESPDQEDLED